MTSLFVWFNLILVVDDKDVNVIILGKQLTLTTLPHIWTIWLTFMCRCVEILINEQSKRYNQKMEEIQQLENAEAMAIKQLKLRRQNTVRNFTY